MQILLIFLWVGLVLSKEAKEVLDAIQKYRLKHNLPRLKVSQALVQTAQDRAESILASGSLFTQSIDISSLAEGHGYQIFSIGENIGKSVNREGNGLDIFKEWINSPVHRENIIDAKDYTHIGVYKIVGEYNIYISAIFARPYTQDPLEKNTNMKKQKSLSITSTHHMAPLFNTSNSNASNSNSSNSNASNLNASNPNSFNPNASSPNASSPNTPATLYNNNFSNANNLSNFNNTLENTPSAANSINTFNTTDNTSTSANPNNAYNTSANTPYGNRQNSTFNNSSFSSQSTSSPEKSSTLLVTLPERAQKEDIVLKLVFTKKPGSENTSSTGIMPSDTAKGAKKA